MLWCLRPHTSFTIPQLDPSYRAKKRVCLHSFPMDFSSVQDTQKLTGRIQSSRPYAVNEKQPHQNICLESSLVCYCVSRLRLMSSHTNQHCWLKKLVIFKYGKFWSKWSFPYNTLTGLPLFTYSYRLFTHTTVTQGSVSTGAPSVQRKTHH